MANPNEKRAEKLREARGIMDRADNERRDLNPEEAKKIDELLEGVDDIDRSKLMEERTGYRLPASGDNRGNEPHFYSNGSQNEDVRTVRALRPDQRLSDRIEGNRNLDFGRYLRGVITGNWDGAEEERDMSIGSNTGGGFLIPSPLSTRIIDKARNQSVILRAGAQTVEMESSTLDIARVDTDPSAEWHAESETLSESQPVFGRIQLQARTLACLTTMSIELFEDSTPNAGELVEDILAQVLALEMDRAALYGIGASSQPLGIKNQSGINSLQTGANGGAITYEKILDGIEDILENNGSMENLSMIMAPRTAVSIAKFEDGDNNPLTVPPLIADLRQLVSNQVSIAETKGTETAASDIFLGNFGQALWGVRTQLVTEVSREAGDSFEKMQAKIRCYMRGDFHIATPSHFSVIEGVTA